MRIRDMGCHSHHQRRTDHADHELHVGRRWRHAAASATKGTSQKWLHPHVHCPDTVAVAVSVGMTWWWWRLVVEVRTGTSNTVCIGRPPNPTWVHRSQHTSDELSSREGGKCWRIWRPAWTMMENDTVDFGKYKKNLLSYVVLDLLWIEH
jgi:hypothetical protein